MATWVYNIAVEEWVREGRDPMKIFTLTQKQWKIYFVDGCIRKNYHNIEYGNGGLGCEIIAGLEEINKFFLPSS